MNEMLQDMGISSEIEVAIDNNCIDRMVRRHRPTHVIIEALWVIPSKFAVLSRLHPDVKWIIRLHSEMPFIAGEGMAMDWIGDYSSHPKIDIGVNAPRMLGEVRSYLQTRNGWDRKTTEQRVFYMPNYYPKEYKSKRMDRSKPHIDVACFGAVRPLKNHLLQAHAALKFANKIGKKLRFHINSGRIEMKGDSSLNNLRGMFQQLADTGHVLISHEWRPRDQFLDLCAEMDIGLQCNFSETFNIVSADLVCQGVPIVGSSEIPWSSDLFNADATKSDEIAEAMELAYYFAQVNVWLNQFHLSKYVDKTKKIWLDYCRGEDDGIQS
jgi:hypothetical protein